MKIVIVCIFYNVNLSKNVVKALNYSFNTYLLLHFNSGIMHVILNFNH